MPTFLGLAGIKVPGGVQGSDLSAAIRGEPDAPLPDSAYLQILDPAGRRGAHSRVFGAEYAHAATRMLATSIRKSGAFYSTGSATHARM